MHCSAKAKDKTRLSSTYFLTAQPSHIVPHNGNNDVTGVLKKNTLDNENFSCRTTTRTAKKFAVEMPCLVL